MKTTRLAPVQESRRHMSVNFNDTVQSGLRVSVNIAGALGLAAAVDDNGTAAFGKRDQRVNEVVLEDFADTPNCEGFTHKHWAGAAGTAHQFPRPRCKNRPLDGEPIDLLGRGVPIFLIGDAGAVSVHPIAAQHSLVAAHGQWPKWRRKLIAEHHLVLRAGESVVGDRSRHAPYGEIKVSHPPPAHQIHEHLGRDMLSRRPRRTIGSPSTTPMQAVASGGRHGRMVLLGYPTKQQVRRRAASHLRRSPGAVPDAARCPAQPEFAEISVQDRSEPRRHNSRTRALQTRG